MRELKSYTSVWDRKVSAAVFGPYRRPGRGYRWVTYATVLTYIVAAILILTGVI